MGKGKRGTRSSRLNSSIRSAIESLEKRVLMASAVEPYILPSSFLTKPGGTLSSPTKGAALTIAMQYLSSHAGDLGLTKADLADPIVTDQYTDSDTGVTHIYLQQAIDGRPVDNTSLNLNITRRGEVLSVGGAFVNRVDEKLNAIPDGPAIPSRWSLQAFSTLGLEVPADSVIAGVGFTAGSEFNVSGISLDPIKPQLNYLATRDGLSLAWRMQARTPDQQHWYDVQVDAYSGKMQSVNDWVDHASYNVLPAPGEAPNDGPGTLGSRAVLTNPIDTAASPFGWHDTNGVAGPEFTDTRGNNVSAQEDADANDTGGFRPDGGAALNFDFPLDLATAPANYRSAAITNLFYWNNLLHDVHYRYGFTEVAGNFQTTNYSGTGLGADAVQADAQDGSGTNNANFATPPDGLMPRMQMYLFNYTSPGRDGDLSNEIITHEYGHGVSNRLTGGPANSNALDALQSGGMGEGWSDWWGMMLTQDPTDTKNAAYPQGTYVLGQSASGAGIRRFPYSFDMALDPLTIANFGTSGTGGGTTRSTEVHNVGEIWCSALWDLNWLLIDKYGYSPTISQGYDPAVSGKNGGNNLALQLVMDGLKLQPANPSFLQARNAILQADQVRTGGANAYQIWTAFARRGMGYSFINSSSSGTSVTAAFDLPAGLLNPTVLSHSPNGVSATPVSSLDLTFSKAMDPASFNISADINSFTGPGNVDLKSSITGATWLNSNQTLRLNFTAQSLNGQYSLNLGPQILGASDAHAMDQNTNGTPGEAGDSYTATFRYDALVGAVTSTSPADGTLVSLPLTNIEFNFNEPVDPASLNATDLTLNQGSVAGVTAVDADTVRFSISGLTQEGILSLNIAAGAISDTVGNPISAYSGSLNLDIGTVPLPGGAFTARNPAGALIYQASATGLLSPGDADSFTVQLDAGQLLSVLANVPAGLSASVEVRDPGNALLRTASSAAVGKDVIIQSIPVTAAGVYTITLRSLNGTSGSVSLGLTLNADLEAEENDGAVNDTRAAAQNLDNAFSQLGATTSSRAAVLGQLPSSTGIPIYTEDWETGTVGSAWSTYSSTSNGRIQLSGQSTGGGAYAMLMDNGTGNGSYVLNEAIWTVNLAGRSAASLSFKHVAFNDENESFSGSYVGHYNADGVSISADGNTWYPIISLDAPSSWTTRTIDLATAASAAGISFNSSFKIKFQQYDNYELGTDGRGFDDISITVPAAAADYYSLTLQAGQKLTAAVTALGSPLGIPLIKLLDASGNLLATSATGASNVSSAINGYTISATGTYYLLSDVPAGVAYSLVALKDAALTLQPHSSSATAQAITGMQGVLGNLGAVSAGTTVTINTANSGWWSSVGSHSATNPNYITGIFDSGTDYRDYFVFDVPGSGATIVAAQLHIFNPSNGFGSPDASETLSIFDVSTPIASLIATGSGQTAIHSDLGSGMVYGTKTVSTAHNGAFVDIPLNSDAIAAINAAAGRQMAFGGAITTLSGTSNQGVFAYTDASYLRQLVLTIASNTDWYSYNVTSTTDGIALTTVTPGDGAGDFVNLLNPHIELYSPAGALVATGTVGSDGRNEVIYYQPPTTGTYRIKVTSEANTAGDYFLSLGDALRINAPAAVHENDGVLSGTISVNAPPKNDTTITLNVRDPGRLNVPATVILGAGQTSVSFAINLLDNALLDGAQPIRIDAAAQGYAPASTTINVLDDETTTLSVSLPAAAREGDIVSGTITAQTAPTRDIVVQLSSSSPTRGSVPASVILPAGQTSVSFDLAAINNTKIDGNQNVTITAAAENWTSGVAGIDIQDEDATISILLPPADAWEGQTLAQAGKVRIGGTLTSPLVVNLASSDLSELGLPASVTIPAGQTEATFTLTLPADGIKDGAQTVALSATAAGQSDGSANLVVHDADLDHLGFAPIAGPKTAAVGFAVSAGAYNIDNEPVAVYNGSATLTATGVAGQLPASPATINFTAGTWTGNVAVNAVDPAVTLSLDGGGVSGASNLFATEPGAVTHFVWSSISSPQIAGVPFTATITAFDANEFVATGFSGPVTFTGKVAPSTVVPLNPTAANFTAGVWSGSITVLQAALNLRIQVQDAALHTGSSNAFNVIQRTLSLVLPPDVRENDGSTVGILNVSPAPTSDLVVALGNSHPSRLGVPATITVPAGQTSVAVPISIINNGLLDGLASVSITAGAATYATGSGVVRVHDNESAVLSVSLPAAAAEADGSVTGTITISDPAINDIVIQLASSKTSRATTPVSVILPAGQTSVNFPLTIIENTAIEGAGLVSITASVENWVSGFRSILISDNDSHMSVSLPAAGGWEGQTLVGAGSVHIGGVLPTDLLIDLSSSSTANLTLPAGVIIPAGQTSASFDITIASDSTKEGVSSYTVTAAALGYSEIANASASINVHDATVDHYVFDPITTPKTAAVTFPATIHAQNVDAEDIPVYNGTIPLNAKGTQHAVMLTPLFASFSSGVWTGNVKVNTVDPGVTLSVDDPSGATGKSNTFAVEPGPVASLQWYTIASSQYSGVPISVTITAKDANGFTATGFNGTANIRSLSGPALTGQTMLGSISHSSFSNATTSYTMGYAFVPAANVTVTHVRSYYGLKVSIWNSSGTLLVNSAVSGTPGVWTDTPLASPITLQAGATYVVGAYVPDLTNYYWANTVPTTSPFGTISQWLYSSGDVKPITTTSGAFLVDLRGDIGNQVVLPSTPSTATFTNGVWSGNVSVLQPATNVRIEIDDGAGHIAVSNNFNVAQRTLTLTVPTSASEAAGIVNGTITIDGATDQDTVVTLTSGNPSRLSVPATVTILAGQTSAVIPITLIDNGLLDGADSITISATAPGISTVSKSMQVTDDEVGVLTVTLPDGATEDGGNIIGTITSSLAPTKATVIQLTSGNTGLLTVPATVTMPAGQTHVSFVIGVINNNQAKINPPVTISASGTGFLPADGSIDIYDEDSFLSLTLPASIWEGQSVSGTARITMGGIRATDTVIDLTSSDISELNGPSTVTILAGQTSATFTVTAGTDGVRDGLKSVQFSASSIGLTGASAGMAVHDRDLDHFTTGVIASPKTANVPFAWTAGAYNIDNELIPLFNDSATISAAGVGGALPLSISTITFTNGTWSGNVRIDALDAGAALTIDNGAGMSASSNTFALQAGAVTHFVWGANPGPQIPGVPFNATITAKDANGYTSDYNGSASLSGSVGVEYIVKTMFANADADRAASSGTNSYGYSFTPDSDLIVTHFRSYFGTKVSLWSNSGTLLASSAVTSVAGTWVETPLATPVTLLAGVTYRIGAYTGGQQYRFRIDMPATTPIGTINQSFYAPGDAFPNGTIALKWAFVDIKANVGKPLEAPVLPGAINFVNGTWSGAITVPFAAQLMRLTIRDADGHSATTADFDVSVQAPGAPLLDSASDSGASSTDGITSRNNASGGSKLSFNVAGTLAGATVRLYANGVLVGSAVSSGMNVIVETDGSTLIADGPISFTTRQVMNGVESPDSAATLVKVDSAMPTLSGAVFEFETRQAVNIDSSETLAGFDSSSFTLVNLSTGQTIPSGKIAVAFAGGKYSLTFPGYTAGVLPDGAYELKILAAAVKDAAGNVATSDLLFNFFVLGGDANRDGKVDNSDLFIISANYPGNGGLFSQGDFNYDGKIDALDLQIFGDNWQKTLPPPLPANPTTAPKTATRRTPTRVINLVQ